MIYQDQYGNWTSVNNGRPYNEVDANLRANWIARNQQAYQQQLANQQALQQQQLNAQDRLYNSFLQQRANAVRSNAFNPNFNIWGR